MEFYNNIADVYDAITHETARRDGAVNFVDWLTSEYHVETVLDVACGAGLFTLEFARQNVRAIGIDIAEDLLNLAREKAVAENLDIQWFNEPMQKSADVINAPVDAIVCMGNSLPHLLEDSDLDATLNEFDRLLKPGAPLVLHMLNYSKVLKNKERMVGVTKKNDVEFVRFYDFLDKLLRFNLLEIDWSHTPALTELCSTTLRPWTVDETIEALSRHHFAEFETFGNLNRGHFDQEESEVLVLVAKKANQIL